MGIAIAMVTGQSGKVAAVVSRKLYSVVVYIVCFSNVRKISNPVHVLKWICERYHAICGLKQRTGYIEAESHS
jgi:hypothetical protein